jgi:putative intracellular protease/amidase
MWWRRAWEQRGRWLALSLLLHGSALAVLYLAPRPPEPPEKLIPVTVIHAETPEETAPEAPLRFREPALPRVRETLVVPPETLALAPPPPDAVLEPEAAGGGLALDVPAAAGFASFSLGGAGGGSAGAGFGAGNGFAARGSFQEYVGGLRQTGLDVVFVIDATGSMGWLISEVKQRVERLALSIRSLVPVTRFGIVAYRDDDDPEFLVRVEPLTLRIAELERFLEQLEARGGGDIPERVDAGLVAAIEKAGWKPESRKVIIVIGDAPPHAERLEPTLAIAREFHGRGGTVTTVDVRFDANPTLAAARLGKRVDELQTLGPGGVMPEFASLARAGGGDGATLEGDRRVVGQLGVLIFGKRFAEEVRPLLGDL